ncbi:MAG: hypothetical protein LBR58_04570 [Propionibacteriaceae bacterium]|nr:hypothetical protein [Propionibacteriaceae bacterium]
MPLPGHTDYVRDPGTPPHKVLRYFAGTPVLDSGGLTRLAVRDRATAALLLARRGSAVDALVVALAEPDGTVLTSDAQDLEALAAYALSVKVEAV